MTQDGVNIECCSEDFMLWVALTWQTGAAAREEECEEAGGDSVLDWLMRFTEKIVVLVIDTPTGFAGCGGETAIVRFQAKHLLQLSEEDEGAPTSASGPVSIMCSHIFPKIRIASLQYDKDYARMVQHTTGVRISKAVGYFITADHKSESRDDQELNIEML